MAGLNPCFGFLHKPQQGKASLVFDLIEEFRPFIVDRAILTALRRNQKITINEKGYLPLSSRREISRIISDYLNAEVKFRGKRTNIKNLIFKQAKSIKNFLND